MFRVWRQALGQKLRCNKKPAAAEGDDMERIWRAQQQNTNDYPFSQRDN
jgi:hypothetical protein